MFDKTIEIAGIVFRNNFQNLKLYRHPFILRYVDFCEAVDSVYLFTEKGSPLSLVLKQQSYLQVSLGLQNIIQVFKVSVVHNFSPLLMHGQIMARSMLSKLN